MLDVDRRAERHVVDPGPERPERVEEVVVDPFSGRGLEYAGRRLRHPLLLGSPGPGLSRRVTGHAI